MRAKLRRGLGLATIGAGVTVIAPSLLHFLNVGRGAAAVAVIGALFLAYEVYSP